MFSIFAVLQQFFRKFTYILVHQFDINFGKHTTHTMITLILTFP